MPDESRKNLSRGGSVWRGLAAGLVGGLIASWTMNRFQDLWSKLAEDNQWPPNLRFSQPSLRPKAEVQPAQDDTTVKAAAAISEGLFHHKLTKNEKEMAGTAVHYSLGTGAGGLYGVTAEFAPEITAGAGLPFGAAFWLIVDEGAVPLLGLSKGPAEYPLSTHVYSLASHLVFGLTAEVVRGAVRRAL
jgi:uncharacterized membrane protein YagU involved in acid resistance